MNVETEEVDPMNLPSLRQYLESKRAKDPGVEIYIKMLDGGEKVCMYNLYQLKEYLDLKAREGIKK
jgi:hypothetical protein